MSGTVTQAAYAKINLTLDVGQKCPDGYHKLTSIMQTVSLCDTVVLSCQSAGVTVVCDDIFLTADARDLTAKAARTFFRRAEIGDGVHIILHKRIPREAGLGGGSADAAAVLRGLNELYGCGFSIAQLCAIGAEVGADVPFCVLGGTALAGGFGEQLTPLPPLRGDVVIVKPACGIPTGPAFAALDRLTDTPAPYTAVCLDAVRRGDLAAVAQTAGNRFEALELPAAVGEAKQALLSNGALCAVMSGSGSAVYGLFPDADTAESAARALPGSFLCKMV